MLPLPGGRDRPVGDPDEFDGAEPQRSAGRRHVAHVQRVDPAPPGSAAVRRTGRPTPRSSSGTGFARKPGIGGPPTRLLRTGRPRRGVPADARSRNGTPCAGGVGYGVRQRHLPGRGHVGLGRGPAAEGDEQDVSVSASISPSTVTSWPGDGRSARARSPQATGRTTTASARARCSRRRGGWRTAAAAVGSAMGSAGAATSVIRGDSGRGRGQLVRRQEHDADAVLRGRAQRQPERLPEPAQLVEGRRLQHERRPGSASPDAAVGVGVAIGNVRVLVQRLHRDAQHLLLVLVARLRPAPKACTRDRGTAARTRPAACRRRAAGLRSPVTRTSWRGACPRLMWNR